MTIVYKNAYGVITETDLSWEEGHNRFNDLAESVTTEWVHLVDSNGIIVNAHSW